MCVCLNVCFACVCAYVCVFVCVNVTPAHLKIQRCRYDCAERFRRLFFTRGEEESLPDGGVMQMGEGSTGVNLYKAVSTHAHAQNLISNVLACLLTSFSIFALVFIHAASWPTKVSPLSSGGIFPCACKDRAQIAIQCLKELKEEPVSKCCHILASLSPSYIVVIPRKDGILANCVKPKRKVVSNTAVLNPFAVRVCTSRAWSSSLLFESVCAQMLHMAKFLSV